MNSHRKEHLPESTKALSEAKVVQLNSDALKRSLIDSPAPQPRARIAILLKSLPKRSTKYAIPAAFFRTLLI